MGCEIFNGPMGPAFMCGPGIGPLPRKKCAFCEHIGRASISLCDWPVERFVLASYADLLVGDWVRRARESRGDIRPAARVLGVAPFFINNLATAPFGLQVGLKIGSRYKEIIVQGSSPVRKGSMGTCDTPCCFRHRRHVGADRDYCMDHWRAWESV